MTRRAIEPHDKKDYTNHHPDALCHPELVSGSVRGEWSEKARDEMLKQVQHDQGAEQHNQGAEQHDQGAEQHDVTR